MPPLETLDRHQKALYWPFDHYDENGQPVVAAAAVEELDVRWVAKRREALSPQGNVVAIDATVIVDREIAVGSILWEGGFEDLPGTALIPASGFMQAVDYSETPDLKGRNVRREVMLMRHSDTLPTG